MKDKIIKFVRAHYKGLIVMVVLVVLIVVVIPKILEKKVAQLQDSFYKTENPTVQDIQVTLTGTGTIEPNDQYAITPRVQGEIIDAPFEEGDVVEKGQLLYQFSTENVEDNIKSADLSVQQAQVTYNDAIKSKKQSKDNLFLTSGQEGYIKKLYVETGDKITVGMTIADLYDNTTMVLDVPFNSADVKNSWVGKRANVYVGDESDKLKGTVKAVAATTTTLSGNMVVKYVTIEVKNPGGIAEGMSGSARVNGVDCNSEGTFSAKSKGTLVADGNGEIEKLMLKEGNYLKKGTDYLKLKDTSVSDAVQNSQLSLDSAKNQLDIIKKSLDDYSVTAPISGTVITKNAKKGDNINASFASPLAVIYDLSKVKFQMNIDELDVLKISVGQEVQVTADALEGEKMTGHITNISLESHTTGGVTEYPVTVEMTKVGRLLPGMNVSATIVLDEKKDALCIPVDALMRGDIVYVQDEESTAEDTKKSIFDKKKDENKDSAINGESENADAKVPVGFHAVEVKVGISSDSYVQILSGLSQEDKIYIPRAVMTDAMTMMMGGPMDDPGDYEESSGME